MSTQIDGNEDLITSNKVNRYRNDNFLVYALSGVCFVFCIVLFLLLFFLIPRPPTVSYSSTTVEFDPSYYVLQSYKINNANMYSLKLYNFDTTLTTNSGGETLTGYGTLNDDDNSNYITAPNKNMQ